MRRSRKPEASRPGQEARRTRLIAAASWTAALGVLAFIVWSWSANSFFIIRHVQVVPAMEHAPDGRFLEVAYLKGRNIFSIDLDTEADRISRKYPSFKKVRLIRVPPDRVFVSLATRASIAQVKLGSSVYSLSEDLVFFEPFKGEAGDALPLITGLERKLRSPVMGRRYPYRDLMIGVEVIKAVQVHKGLQGYRVRRIDLSNLNDITFALARPAEVPAVTVPGAAEAAPDAGTDLLEVKISQEHLRNKLRLLSELFLQLKAAADTIKYVDMRFSDPVIKLKEATER
jgi:cell division septal protein FtsQ